MLLRSRAFSEWGHPVPRTATEYYLEPGCEMLTYGFTIESSTGLALPFAQHEIEQRRMLRQCWERIYFRSRHSVALLLWPSVVYPLHLPLSVRGPSSPVCELGLLVLRDGCTDVGCGATEPFSFSCTIVARQGPGLTARAQMTVSVLASFGYPANPLIFSGSQRIVAPFASGSFVDELVCTPKEVEDEFSTNRFGWLIWNSATPSSTGGLSVGEPFNETVGGICRVTHSSGETANLLVLIP